MLKRGDNEVTMHLRDMVPPLSMEMAVVYGLAIWVSWEP